MTDKQQPLTTPPPQPEHSGRDGQNAPPRRSPPQISPYLFPLLLAGFGLWCLYDGWFNPEMQEHLLFNRITGSVLILWSVLDFFRTRRLELAGKQHRPDKKSTPPDLS